MTKRRNPRFRKPCEKLARSRARSANNTKNRNRLLKHKRKRPLGRPARMAPGQEHMFT